MVLERIHPKDIGTTPLDNAQINRSIQQSVQEFPAPVTAGAFFVNFERGPLLPPYGTKARDQQLRLIHRSNYNLLWQGAVSGIISRVISTAWEISGPPARVKYFQSLLQNAQFGKGWASFLSMLLEDYFTQDFGGVVELIGPGDPRGPIDGAISGIAHLDAGRCYVTGNPYFPLHYYSLWSGSLHRMHASRVYRMTDSPSPDERYFGNGMCSLSRAISAVNREQLMARYIEQRVDDRPQPGIMTIKGMTDGKFNDKLMQYARSQAADAPPILGNVMVLTSVQVEQPIEVKIDPFAQTPEKFDWIQYVSLDVNEIAVALGVDRQDIFPLEGGNMGTGAQSQILAEKARGKAFGKILTSIERMINLCVLPEDCEFTFKYRDETEQARTATFNQTVASTVSTLMAPGAISVNEARQFLANVSEEFKDVLTDETGKITAPDNDRVPQEESEVILDDANPHNVTQQEHPAPGETATVPQDVTQTDNTQKALKAFSATAADFTRQFVRTIETAQDGRLGQDRFADRVMLFLPQAVTNAYVDGLQEGGITASELDDSDEATIQDIVYQQIDSISNLENAIYIKGERFDPFAKTQLWVNKALRQAFNDGRMSADKNAKYIWKLGRTEEHCTDCIRLNGQVHRYKEWFTRDWLPQSGKLDCGGWRCDCRLEKTDLPADGRF